MHVLQFRDALYSRIDARARALTSDWAETSNTDQIPANKLNNAPAGDDAYNWATEGNTAQIPANKLNNAPAGDDAYNWATVGNSDQIPANKLNNAGDDGDDAYDWATVGNTNQIPANKLNNAPGGDDAFDWATVGNINLVPNAKLTSETLTSIADGDFIYVEDTSDGRTRKRSSISTLADTLRSGGGLMNRNGARLTSNYAIPASFGTALTVPLTPNSNTAKVQLRASIAVEVGSLRDFIQGDQSR